MSKRQCDSYEVNNDLVNSKVVKSNNSAMTDNRNHNGYPLSYTIPTTNTFKNFLTNNKFKTNNATNNNNAKSNQSGIKLPPIVTKINANEIRKIMFNLKINKYDMKITSMGVKLNLYDLNHYKTVLDVLKQHQAEFFSYTLDENRTSRYTLLGMPSMPVEDIESYIKEVGLVPSRITKIEPKAYKSKDTAIYFVSFPKTITLGKLKNFRYLGHIACKWDVPHKKPERVTQCFKCFLYGHTSGNCNMKPKCQYCSVTHAANEECLLKEKEISHKCANCDGNHAANSVICPRRSEFLRIREQINNSNTRYNHKQPFSLSAVNFPNTLGRQEEPHPSQSLIGNSASKETYANTLNRTIQPCSTSQGSANQLYSSAELLIILESVMVGLRQCTTPAEQVNVILETAIKYVCK